MLHQLPTEIALQAISLLPLHSLYSISLVSRDWNALIAINEPTVYRNAAITHHFIDEDQFRTGSMPVNWRTYCRRQLEIERGWRGKGPSVVRELKMTGNTVHRIKIDHGFGFVITTSLTGGLFVCDIQSDHILWALPQSHVVPYAHLEYDRGYIVFNRYDNCKEVWRHTMDTDDGQHPGMLPPDKKMVDASVQAAAKYDSAESLHGHFKAWALLTLPEGSRAFRFSYPSFLAVGTENAYIWDIPRLQLVLVVRNIQEHHHGFSLGAIKYVEVNDQYVFICSASGLRIFAREGGVLLYHLFTRELPSATWDVLPQTSGLASSVVHPQTLFRNPQSSNPFHGGFFACHVSASGNDLVTLTSNGRLVILPDFQRLFSGPNIFDLRQIATILNFQPSSSDRDMSYYLAVGNQYGKLAIATRKGIYVVSLDFDFNRLTADRPPEPGVSVCRLSKFENEHFLFTITCLQVTHDAIYFTYKASQMDTLLETAHHHLHGVHAPDNPHDPVNVDVVPDVVDAMDDGFVDGWQDENSEDEEIEMDGEDEFENDHLDVVMHNLFLPTASNAVYRVGF